MQLEAFLALFTRQGQFILEAAEALVPREKDFLQDFKLLNKRYPTEVARMALTIAILREEAGRKFPQARKMFFERSAFEQASSWEVAAYRAARYAGLDRVLDLGCSIGGDTLALAEVTPTIGVDYDDLRVQMARANAAALGLAERTGFIQAELTAALPLQLNAGTGIFFDPARRKNGQRIHSVRDYEPPLGIVEYWLPQAPAVGVKISPGVKLEELSAYDAEIEFISLKGELKEAVLWFGPLKTTERRATLLPGEHTLTAEHIPKIPLSEPRAYIYEPDPAILRAGLVTVVGEQLNAAQLDAEIAYLTADAYVETPFARAWQVEDWLPFQLKRLRAFLRERNVGRVTVKKRGSPIVPEDLIRDLRLEGEQEKMLFLTQMQGKPIVVIAVPNQV
ncbi:MAG: methyltransferase domain-containing protein [Anaerolineales bacterium]|nr:methyltransferase domain-containing protein [Anaerolineales bacterium]